MHTLEIILYIVSVATIGAFFLSSKKTQQDYARKLFRLQQDSAERDQTLNYVLKTFNLTVSDPYILRPGYDEKRCYHCHIPEGFRHADDCPCNLVHPVVTKLYGK